MTQDHSTRPSVMPLVAAVFAFAALAVTPGAWDGAFSGVRYSSLQAATLVATFVAALALCIFQPRRPTRWRGAGVIAALVVVRAGLGIVDVPAGWRGEYTMVTPAPAKVGGFAWRLAHHPFRIDPDLRFEGAELDLQFLNDYHRYNRPTFAPPRATSQALTFRWIGWFEAPADATLEVFAAANGTTEIWLDQARVAVAGPAQPPDPPRVAVHAGWHRLTVMNSKPAGTPPSVFARFLVDDRPIDVRPWRRAPWVSGRLLAGVDHGIVALGGAMFLWHMVLAFAGAAIRRGGRTAGAVAAMAAVGVLAVGAVKIAAPFANRTYELRPGDDHLAYEGLARHILAEGVLMPEGKAPGAGTPFYFYPLYSYTLAAFHLALGDSHATIMLMNAAAAAALPVFFWALGLRRLRGEVQVFGQVALLVFIWRHNARYFESPVTDSLFIPLVFGTLVLAARALRSMRLSDAFLVGCGTAACATTRPSFFLFMGAYLLVVLWWPRTTAITTRLGSAAAVVAGYTVALAPVVLRNWIMAGQAVAVVSLSHAIPISLVPPEALTKEFQQDPRLFAWDTSLQLARDLILADPLGVAWLETRKALFTLGLTNLGPGQPALIPEFPLLTLLGVAALLSGRVPGRTAAVLVAFLVSHLAAVVIAYPWTYGYKTIIPVHLVFLFCALHLVSRHREAGADA